MSNWIWPFAVALLTLCIIAKSQDIIDEDADICIASATECRCAPNVSKGTCMRHQGGGKCLLGVCNEGYRCDCFGFEMCSIRPCAQYTANAVTVPSDTIPFGCTLTRDIGSCHDAVRFVETLAGADNAETAASTDLDDATTAELEATQQVLITESYKVEVNTAMKSIEQEGAKVSEDDREEVQHEAEIVENLVLLVSVESQAAIKAGKESSHATRQARKKRQEARAKQAEIDKKKDENTAAAEAAGGEEKCNPCAALKAQIAEMRKQRRQAAIEAGTWARKGREFRKEANDRREKAKQIALDAEEAKKRCLEKAAKILEKLKAASAS